MKWPDPPEHSVSRQAHGDELFWQALSEHTDDTPAQARERYESAKARYRLAHKFDFLKIREEEE